MSRETRVVPWKVAKADGVRDTPQVIDQTCDRTTVYIQPPFRYVLKVAFLNYLDNIIVSERY